MGTDKAAAKAAKKAAAEAAWAAAQADIARHDDQFAKDNPDWEKKHGGGK